MNNQNEMVRGMPVSYDAVAFSSNGKKLMCPSKGRYEIGVIGESPRCSLHGRFFVSSRTREDPLFKAAREGDMGLLKNLLKNHDVNRRTDDGWTCLHYAAFAGNIETVKFLLDRGAKPDITTLGCKTPLDLTIDKDIIACLLEHGAKSIIVSD